MKVNIDRRERNSMYVDKFNNHIANNDEIIKLDLLPSNGLELARTNDIFDSVSRRFIITEFIGRSLGLSGIALMIFITITCHLDGKCAKRNILAKQTIEYFNLTTSVQNIYQMMKTLTDKCILIYTPPNSDRKYDYMVNPKYYVGPDAEYAKFIVIEVNPEDTSSAIKLGV